MNKDSAANIFQKKKYFRFVDSQAVVESKMESLLRNITEKTF